MLLSELTQGLGTVDPVVDGKFSGLQLTGLKEGKYYFIWALAIFLIPSFISVLTAH